MRSVKRVKVEFTNLIAAVLALLIAIIGHEIMHGYIAYLYKDTTAKDAGRLSLNPLVHIDPIGSILVPALLYFIPMLFGASGGFLFGWAKPVPVNINRVINQGGYSAAIQVSLAGIAYNLLVATLASIVLMAIAQPSNVNASSLSMVELFTQQFVLQLLIINVVLAIFNLLPIPQFDGAHVLIYAALKMKARNIALFMQRLEPYGMIIALIVIVTPLKEYLIFLPVKVVLGLLLLQ